MKFYITLVNGEHVNYPPTIVKCNSLLEARIKTLEYWSDDDLKRSNISAYCINGNLFIGEETVVEIPIVWR